MTPQEKAKELINRYSEIEIEPGRFDGYITMNLYEAIKCAIIAVDEILKTIMSRYLINNQEVANFQIEKMVYWQEVKEELIKLKQ
jgi:branched-subunit amino acid permease